MNKLFFYSAAAFVLFAFNTNALVIQKAGSALAYKNVVSPSGNTSTPQKKIVKQTSSYSSNLTSLDSDFVSMAVGDDVTVSLPETSGHTWSYNASSCLSFSETSTSGNVKKMVFKLSSRCSGEAAIDFDQKRSSDGQITRNKSLVVRTR